MYTVRELQSDEHEKWNAFLAKSPQGSLFHTLEWNQMLVDTDPQTSGFLPLLCVDKNDAILAALTVPYRLDSDRRIADRPFFGYTTPLLADSLRYADRHHTYASYSALVDLTKSLVKQIGLLQLQNSPDIWDIRSYMFNAWKIDTVYTHELSLAEDLWQKIDAALQTSILQNEEKYSLHADSTGKWDEAFAKYHPQIHAEILKKRLAWMRATGTGRLFALTDSQNHPLAFTLAMLSQPDQRTYLWGTFCMDAKTESDILPALFWQVCATLKSDCPRLDLGYSANIQVSQIKDKLGGRLLPAFITSYPKNEKSSKQSDDVDDE
jgi:hypothetical protein